MLSFTMPTRWLYHWPMGQAVHVELFCYYEMPRWAEHCRGQ